MKRAFVFIIFLVYLGGNYSGYSWGFKAHRIIAQMAIFTLPVEMIPFYKTNWEKLKQASIQPDIRRYVWEEEKPNHYIDFDHYSEDQQDSMQLNWGEVIKFIPEDTLTAYGILPYALSLTKFNLTRAMSEKNGTDIIRYSGDLAHYVGDAHVPLHTTTNYNGQFTGQKGIHALWESKIPELEAEDYTFWQERAIYITDVKSAIWNTILHSHSLVDSVLSIEQIISDELPQDKKYTFAEAGKKTSRTYSRQFISLYSTRMQGMVERQMQASIQLTGNLWYTCWVDAGQPDLSTINFAPDPEPLDSITFDQQPKNHHE